MNTCSLPKKRLVFPANRRFKILQFTDMHLSYRRNACFLNKTMQLVERAICDEKPDLVVITGDLVWSPFTERAYGEIVSCMERLRQPWTFVFGNHDRDFLPHSELLENVVLDSPFCLYQRGDMSIPGNGTYTIPLCDEQGDLRWMFYFLDTGDVSHYPRVGGYSHITMSQLNWFRETAAQTKREHHGYASAVFMHKAIPEFRTMWEQGGCRGVRYEPEGCALVNPGLFCAMLEDGTVRGVFVGHDHGNNYSGTYHGIRLSYGAITGYNNFARNGLGRDLMRGARVILLGQTGEIDSYFYFEDGRRRDEDLNLMEPVDSLKRNEPAE